MLLTKQIRMINDQLTIPEAFIAVVTNSYYKLLERVQIQIEFCFAREKEIVFAQYNQSVPMSINDFVKLTIFLCSISFSIYAKI